MDRGQNAVDEKNMMLAVDHDFILRLYTTYADEKRLYMLLEFVQGGELLSVLKKKEKKKSSLKQAEVQFYAGSVLLALEHVHSRSIVYRDLKPENVR